MTPLLLLVYLISISRRNTFNKGCCCDSRRAVIIVNFIDFIFVLIAILLAVATNDDIGAGWAVLIIDIIIVALTIAGAALYNKWLVILGCLWAVINLTLRIVAATQGLSYFAVTVNGEVIRLPWLEVILAFIWEGLILYVSSYSFKSFFLTKLQIQNIISLMPSLPPKPSKG
jgi:hypothetical protein